ncbi:hypothetical protein L7F22_014169 [Adiantum nelumboides]|nr:hypothetical protein [Adiantum nelumboides]
MFDEATIMIAKFEIEGPQLPQSFEAFFKTSRKTHVSQAYTHVLGSIKSASDYVSLPEVVCCKRLVYRWLLECLRLKTFEGIHDETTEWLDKDDENIMFSPSILEKGITPWESTHCPWWLEYPLGVIPKCKKDLHELFLKEEALTLGTKATSQKLPQVGTPSKVESRSKKQRKGLKGKQISYSPKEDDEEESLPATFYLMQRVCVDHGISRSFLSGSIQKMSQHECMPLKRMTGENFITHVDALLVDVEEIDDLAWNRNAGESISPEMFPARTSYLTESPPCTDSEYTRVSKQFVRGGAERTKSFFSWLLATFTYEDDHVMDVFAGCGGLGAACTKEICHCLMLEGDIFAFFECLEGKVCGPSHEDDI